MAAVNQITSDLHTMNHDIVMVWIRKQVFSAAQWLKAKCALESKEPRLKM